MFCHQGMVLLIQWQQRIALLDAITIAIMIENCELLTPEEKRYTAFGRTIQKTSSPNSSGVNICEKKQPPCWFQ